MAAKAVPGTMILSGRVLKIVDGDSLRVRIAGWPRAVNPVELRLDGVDTPELPPRAKCAAEFDMARRARDFVLARLPPDSGIAIAWTAHRYDSFGRMLVKVAAADVADLGEALLGAGLAREYHGGRRAGWCD
jgi:micrococcal nuclease